MSVSKEAFYEDKFLSRSFLQLSPSFFGASTGWPGQRTVVSVCTSKPHLFSLEIFRAHSVSRTLRVPAQDPSVDGNKKKSGVSMGVVWAQDFNFYPPVVASSSKWLQVV